jgi:hypothetical protein
MGLKFELDRVAYDYQDRPLGLFALDGVRLVKCAFSKQP